MRNNYIQSTIPDILSEVEHYYNENHRFYHNWQHIVDGFELAEKLNISIKPSTQIAWLFHDVIYLPFNINSFYSNEKLSADFLIFFFKSNYPEFYLKNEDLIMSAKKIIIGTEKHIPYDIETEFLYDIDLSYLALDYDLFLQKRELIRKEYAWISDIDFYKGTIVFYTNLLNKEFIFNSDICRKLFEKKCRKNLIKNKDECLRFLNKSGCI